MGRLPGLGCRRSRQPVEVGLIGRLPVKAGVRSAAVVEAEVTANHNHQRAGVTAGITVRRVGFRALANNTDDRSCDHGGRNLKPRSGLNLRPTDRRVL